MSDRNANGRAWKPMSSLKFPLLVILSKAKDLAAVS